MQQIYSRTPIPKSDFNEVARQLYRNYTSVCVFSCKFAVYFQNTFSLEHLWRAASVSLQTAPRLALEEHLGKAFKNGPSKIFKEKNL